MLHRNMTARRRSGGFKGGKRMAGIALAQLAIAIGLSAVLVATAVTAGLELFNANQVGNAKDEVASMVVGLGNARSQRTLAQMTGTAVTQADVARWVRSGGGRNVIGQANAFGDTVTVLGGSNDQIVYPTGSLENCAEIAETIAASNRVTFATTAGVASAPSTRTTATTIDLACNNGSTTAADEGDLYIAI